MPINIDAVARQLAPIHLRSIVESTARINLWQGSVRSGKTVSSLLRFLMAVAAAPTSGRILVFGKTRESIARNVFSVLCDPAIFGPLARLTTYNSGAATATILGREIDVLGANDATAEPKVRGMTLALAYGDELTVIPEAFFTQVLARLSVKGAQLFGTTNPDGPNHWLRRKFLLRQGDLNLRSWHSTLDDNPHLDPDYVRDLKAEYTGLWYRRFVRGDWCMAEGAIFDGWDEQRHIIRGQVPDLVRLPGLGVDYGTTNPFAALMLGVTTDGRLCLAREYRWDSKLQRRQLTDAEYSERLRTWLGDDRPEWICVDPSAASFSTQLFRDGLMPVAADNSVVDGIRLVASLLARGLLVVHESCTGWCNEITGYSWDDKATAKGEDKPIKVDDHSLDAGRYVIKTTEQLWRPMLARTDLTTAA
jgi:PBSX family phage terminase large subunit